MVWFICGTNTFLAKCPKFTRFAGLRGFFLRIQGGGSSPTHLPANLVWAVHGGGGLDWDSLGVILGVPKNLCRKTRNKNSFPELSSGSTNLGEKNTHNLAGLQYMIKLLEITHL